jgi:uncharacterized RDD family membrane protein YckC
MNKNIVTKPNIWKRLFAGLIDYLIIFVFTYLIFDIWGEKDLDGEIQVEGFAALLITFMWFFFTVILEQFYGATLGNSIFNLKPISIKNNNRKLTFGQSLKRHLLDTIDLSPLCIGILLIKNTEKNQRLGDLWAKTIVIDNINAKQTLQQKSDLIALEKQFSKKKNIGNYIIKRIASALIDLLVFALIMKTISPYIGIKDEDGYYLSTFIIIIGYFTFVVLQDLLFKRTLGKFIFKLKIELLETKNDRLEYQYLRIISRRIFDIFEIICFFIYIIPISISNKNQKLGDMLTKIVVVENEINKKNIC